MTLNTVKCYNINMQNLADQKCIPCEGGTARVDYVDAEILVEQLQNWVLNGDAKYISKNYTFKNFKEALDFVNKVGDIAEAEGHHPDIELGWGKVKITLTTHAIHGLSNNDFILAAKIDGILI